MNSLKRLISSGMLMVLIMGTHACGDDVLKPIVRPPDPEPEPPDPVLPAYPIYINYVESEGFPEFLKLSVQRAAESWSELLRPTERADFEFTRGFAHVTTDICGGVFYSKGTVLPPGLHVTVRYVQPRNARGVGWACGTSDQSLAAGISHVPTVPVAEVGFTKDNIVSAINRGAGEELKGEVYRIMRHELGHVFGVGLGPRWRSQITASKSLHNQPYGSVFPDSQAVQALTSMVGAGFPSSTPKVGIDQRRAHWDPCLGISDVMQAGTAITILTASSLREGYKIDPAKVETGPIDPSAWNRDFGRFKCVNGQQIPKPSSTVQDRSDVEYDVIW